MSDDDTDVMSNLKRVIMEYFNDSRLDTGLAVLSPPTGSTKTSSTLDDIFDCYRKGDCSRWIFITPRLNNLPTESLRARFADAHLDEEAFERDVLELKRNGENIKDFMWKVSKNDDGTWTYHGKRKDYKISKDLTNAKDKDGKNVFYVLWAKCRSYSELENIQDKDIRKALEASCDDEILKIEKQLRRILKSLLKNRFATPDAIRDELFREGSEWEWVPEMYPAAKIERKKIILMSVSKMFFPMDFIYKSNVLLYDSPYIEGMRIVLDEFDACKDDFLKQCISQMLQKSAVDPIKLYKDLCVSIDKTTIHQDLDFRGAGDSLSENQILKAKAQNDFEKSHLDMNFRTDMDSLAPDDGETHVERRILLFSDDRYLTLTSKRLYVIPDKARGQNSIMLSGEPDGLPEEQELSTILGGSYGFSRYVANNVYFTAKHYYFNQLEAGRYDTDESKAINSVLHTFGFSETTNDYLKSLMNEDFSLKVTADDELDLSVYGKGFAYYALYNDLNDAFRSGILYREFRLFPETILLKMCRRAKVLGLSATGSINNPLGNFDLEYLKNMLNDNYYVFSREQEESIQRQIDAMNSHYDKVNIHTITIPPKDIGEYSKVWWEKIFKDKNVALDAYDLGLTVKRSKKHYVEIRHFCIAYAYYLFVTKDIRSFLSILNKYPEYGDSQLDLGVLEKICLKLEHAYRDKNAEKSKIEVLKSENFDAKKASILGRLQKGERVFVISVFAVTGTAQNMQYGIPDEIKDFLVQINDLARRSEKDFDAIYIEKPTNMIPQIKNNMSEESIVNAIVDYEYMYQAGDITRHKLNNLIGAVTNADWASKETDSEDDGSLSQESGSLYNLPSVISKMCAVYAQALGRIGRTNMKSKDIYICTQKDMLKYLDPDVFKDIHISHELKVVLDSVKEDRARQSAVSREKNIAEKKSDKTHLYIMNLVKGVWNDRTIERWTKIREFVRKHPTLTDDEYASLKPFERSIVDNMYIRLPVRGNRLAYIQTGDYASVKISFGEKPNGWQEVSQECARLAELMSAPEIRDEFRSNGDACEWAEGDYIMTPALFGQVYLGAIGEAAVKAILDKFGIKLAALTDPAEFEKADFKVPGSRILVDSKHWKLSTQKDAEDVCSKICEKLKGLDYKAIYIMNCLKAGNFTGYREVPRDGLMIVEVPYLYDPDTGTYNIEAIAHLGRMIYELRADDESDGA